MSHKTPAQIIVSHTLALCEDGDIQFDNVLYDIDDILDVLRGDQKSLKSFQNSLRAIQNHCVEYLMETSRHVG